MKYALHAHPLLLATAPIVFLYARNRLHFTLVELACWLAIALAATGLALLLSLAWLRRAPAAAALVSCGVLLFMLYGHAFDILWHPAVFGRLRYLHLTMLTCVAGVFAMVAWRLLRTRRDLTQLSASLTLGTSLFMLMAAAPLAGERFAGGREHIALKPEAPAAAALSFVETPAELPDIYYLILDGYARDDVLKRYYAFDNREFLDFLRGKGFYIAQRSCANYHQTRLSLSATLHLRYHDQEQLRNPANLRFFGMIHRPLVAELLQAQGYRYVHMRTEWPGTRESPLANESLNTPNGPLTGYMAFSLRQTTMARIWDGVKTMDYGNSILETFGNLPAVAARKEPTFTFAHIVAPHPPYIFDRNGRRRYDIDQDSPQAYVDQVVFVNNCVQRAVEQVLARSASPPVIIIQSDHGAGYFSEGVYRTSSQDDERYLQERIPVLNAMLVPEAMRSRLYPTISPVNTFRLLLSSCFARPYELLPDRHYIAFGAELTVKDVTDWVRDGVPLEVADRPQQEEGTLR